ncbi:MAG: DUF4349 domain-containing protein [Clostridia bacterium]|nr:DUF4349 domain-containing protein [Clostridia bacterium]
MENDRLDAALSRLYQKTDAPESFETGWRAAVRREESIRMMNKPVKKNLFMKRLVPALAVLVLIVGGLWAGEQNLSAPQSRSTMDTGMVAASRSANKMVATEDYIIDEEAVMFSSASSSDSVAGGYGSAIAPQAQENRKIVRTADLTVRTTAFDEAQEAARSLLASMGGYVENLYQYGETVRRVSLSMRVPSDRLDEFLTGAEGLGRVTDRSESATDMTTQYVDNQARLETLYAKRDRLNELLLKAEDVADLIEIESAIADTQYQIDSFESSQRSIDSRVDMSYVNLTIIEETPASTAVADVTLTERLSAALKASVEWLGEFGRNVLVFVVMILPVAVPLAVVVIVWRLIARIRRKNKED